MHAFEKELKKREMLTPAFSYSYKVVPLSDQAKFYYAVYLKRRITSGLHLPVSKVDLALVNEKNLAKHPFSGQLMFYYEDPKETAEIHETMVREHALQNMARSTVSGFSHKDVSIKKYIADLVEGTDYRIEIGERVIYEQPKTLTFDDIKAL